jgi:hypothetical protein
LCARVEISRITHSHASDASSQDDPSVRVSLSAPLLLCSRISGRNDLPQ